MGLDQWNVYDIFGDAFADALGQKRDAQLAADHFHEKIPVAAAADNLWLCHDFLIERADVGCQRKGLGI